MNTKNNIPANITKDEYKNAVLELFNSKNKVTNITVQENNTPIDEAKKKWNMNDKILDLFAHNIERDQKLKEKYAIILIIILAILLVALIVIFILKGCGVLSYSDSTFNIFITGGIAEIFILVGVIVKYLFKDNLSSALNIILENNNQTKYYKTNRNSKNNK